MIAPTRAGTLPRRDARPGTSAPARRPRPVADAARARADRLRRRLDGRWSARTTVLVLATAYLAYALAHVVGDDPGAALAHARSIAAAEAAVGLDVEAPLQRALDAPALVWLLGRVYLAAQFVVAPLALAVTAWRSRLVFRRLRDTLLLSWLLATPVDAALPVAPPRLADVGVADTITASGSSAMTSPVATVVLNPFAAVPSLHVAFALAVGAALAALTRRGWLRLLALAWGPVVAVTVMATGNHFALDALAGAAVVALAAALSVAVHRPPRPRTAAAAGPVGDARAGTPLAARA